MQNGLSVEIDDPVRNGAGFVVTNNGAQYSLSGGSEGILRAGVGDDRAEVLVLALDAVVRARRVRSFPDRVDPGCRP